MGEIAAVEWFGAALPHVGAMRPPSIAEAITDRLHSYIGRPYPEALTDLLKKALNTRGETDDPVLRFLAAYQPIFQQFEAVFHHKEAREAQAVFNQQLAQGLYVAQTREAIRKPATLFVQTVRALNDAEVQLGVACNIIVSGARAQAGLMRIFESNGYSLVLPDVSQPGEVWRWDIEAGVDFAAVHPKQPVVVLIDAKSQSREGPDYEDFHYDLATTPTAIQGARWRELATLALGKIGQNPRAGQTCYTLIALHNRVMDDLGRVGRDFGNQLVHSLEKRLRLR